MFTGPVDLNFQSIVESVQGPCFDVQVAQSKPAHVPVPVIVVSAGTVGTGGRNKGTVSRGHFLAQEERNMLLLLKREPLDVNVPSGHKLTVFAHQE